MFALGRASDPNRQFSRALAVGNFDDAWRMAQHLPVSLENAVRLTVLAGRARSPFYERMAIRLLSLLIEDRQLTVAQVRWLAERFQDAREGLAKEAEEALRKFVRAR